MTCNAGCPSLVKGLMPLPFPVFFSVRNPDHELQVAQMVKDRTGLPVVCGHMLSFKLGAIERAITVWWTCPVDFHDQWSDSIHTGCHAGVRAFCAPDDCQGGTGPFWRRNRPGKGRWKPFYPARRPVSSGHGIFPAVRMPWWWIWAVRPPIWPFYPGAGLKWTPTAPWWAPGRPM